MQAQGIPAFCLWVLMVDYPNTADPIWVLTPLSPRFMAKHLKGPKMFNFLSFQAKNFRVEEQKDFKT